MKKVKCRYLLLVNDRIYSDYDNLQDALRDYEIWKSWGEDVRIEEYRG